MGLGEDERATGPDAVRALLEAIAGAPVELDFDWDERELHVEGEVAWVNARGTVRVDGASFPYRTTAIFVLRDGRWLWHTHSGSAPQVGGQD